jgi:hypothetical protein
MVCNISRDNGARVPGIRLLRTVSSSRVGVTAARAAAYLYLFRHRHAPGALAGGCWRRRHWLWARALRVLVRRKPKAAKAKTMWHEITWQNGGVSSSKKKMAKMA